MSPNLALSLLPLILADVLGVAAQSSVTDYAPQTNVACPDSPLVRVFTPNNQSLHERETAYIQTRLSDVIPQAWSTWLDDGSALGYNLSVFSGHFPTIGIAVSGGGYRAALYGAGVLSALDARNTSSVSAGTGGFLQVTSYLAALSGGSWLSGSLYFNDWPTISDLVLGNGDNLSGWLLDLSLATPGGIDLFDDQNQAFYGSLLWSVEAKANKGIDTSLTDPWSRMISYHFLNETDRSNFFTNNSAHGAGQLWSRIPQIPSYQQYTAPFPIVVTDSRPVGSNSTAELSPESVVYEITPLEFGSWDPNLSAMTNVTYIGTNLNNSEPSNSTACVTGFDQASFMMGTSSSLLNQILDSADNTLAGFSSEDSSGLLYVLSRQLTEVSTRANDVANWPNPFQSIKPAIFQDSNSAWLNMIDGASNDENVPFGSLFVRARGLDVVVAVDCTANLDTHWPNGSAVINSQKRMASILLPSHQQLPPIPLSADDFISTGVNQRPTFFGCDPAEDIPEWPLVIYLPNSPPINGDDPVTNTATFKLSYTAKHTSLFLDQVHANTIGGFLPNETGADPNWGKCLQCAAIDRARYKLIPRPTRSPFCSTCFKQYCFDPHNAPNSTEIVGRKYNFVDPDPQGLSGVKGFLNKNKTPLIIGLVFLVLLIAGLSFLLFWWKKRKDREYKRLTILAEDVDAPWMAYSDSLNSFELPKRRSGLGI